MINDIYEAICSVSLRSTDFYVGFDILFQFMAENPTRETTKDFIQYHIEEMGDPRLPDGRPQFTYLIGKPFVPEDWVSEGDMYAFHEYTHSMNILNI